MYGGLRSAWSYNSRLRSTTWKRIGRLLHDRYKGCTWNSRYILRLSECETLVLDGLIGEQ